MGLDWEVRRLGWIYPVWFQCSDIFFCGVDLLLFLERREFGPSSGSGGVLLSCGLVRVL